MSRLALLLVVLAACTQPVAKKPRPTTEASLSDEEGGHIAHLYGELQDDILSSYDRDEPPDLDFGMVDPRIGVARIGAGPTDIYIAGDLARAPSRWPLPVDKATRTTVRSKNLQIQLSIDQQAAWMSDELSWRLELCGRNAVIPLRITALYAHDGDRWIPVFEHLSFAWAPSPKDAPPTKPIKTEVISGDLRDELSGVVGRGLLRSPHDPSVLAEDAGSTVLGPDAGDEWHGAHVLDAQLPAGRLEDRRVGLVGRDLAAATIAYWVGIYNAEVPARNGFAPGRVRMRATYVFEKRHAQQADPNSRLHPEADSCTPSLDAKQRAKNSDCRWVLVQAHLSQPITDEQLTQLVFGTAVTSTKPIALDCSDGSPAKPTTAAATPAAAPGRAPAKASPPAAQTP